MTNKPKARGTAAESAVVRFLHIHGFRGAERQPLRGNRDQGDITVCPGVIAEVKTRDGGRLPRPAELDEWLAQTKTEIRNAGAELGLLVIRRRGYQPAGWWAIFQPLPVAILPSGASDVPVWIETVHPWWPLAEACEWLRMLGWGDPLDDREGIRGKTMPGACPNDSVMETPNHDCPTCGGGGFHTEVMPGDPDMPEQVECPDCAGTGEAARSITNEKSLEARAERIAKTHIIWVDPTTREVKCECGWERQAPPEAQGGVGVHVDEWGQWIDRMQRAHAASVALSESVSGYLTRVSENRYREGHEAALNEVFGDKSGIRMFSQDDMSRAWHEGLVAGWGSRDEHGPGSGHETQNPYGESDGMGFAPKGWRTTVREAIADLNGLTLPQYEPLIPDVVSRLAGLLDSKEEADHA